MLQGFFATLDCEEKPSAFGNFFGNFPATFRQLFRQNILAVSLDDLQRVTQTYLRAELASTAVITSSGQQKEATALAEELSLTVCEL